MLASAPITGQWAVNGGGDWSSPANWSGGIIPGVPQDTAVFGAVLTAGTATVNLDIPVSLAGVAFSPNGVAGYIVNSANLSSLTLSNTAGPATISSTSGTNEIAAPITMEGNLSVSAGSGSLLTISGAITESGSSYGLSFSGGGELVLRGVNNYTGGTTVSDGTLVVASEDSLTDGIELDRRRSHCLFACSLSFRRKRPPSRLCPNRGGCPAVRRGDRCTIRIFAAKAESLFITEWCAF